MGFRFPNWIQDFGIRKNRKEGMVYLGSDDITREPDVNGKTYVFFSLVGEGKHKGKYKACLATISPGITAGKMRDREAFDIYNSGFEIVSLNDYEIDEVVRIKAETASVKVECHNCKSMVEVNASDFAPNKDGYFLDDVQYGFHCEICEEQIIILTKNAG